MSTAGWVSLAILGVFGSGIAYLTWYDALQTLPAAQLSVFIYIEPLVTVFAAALFLAESITLASLIGGALTVAGVALVNRR
jgi:drug/metabolite transporter (DMT)-like permease